MNSKSTDDSAIIEVPVELSTTDEPEGASQESRSERIRRLNRERQRRRRMKLKMSRHEEPSMASEACNVNLNLDNLESFENANTEHHRTDSPVKVETSTPESGGTAARATRGRSSRRKRPYSEAVSNVEAANPAASDSANNAITEECHGQIITQGNELSEATDQLSVLVVASEIEVFGEDPNVLNGAGNEGETSVSSEIGEAKRSTRSRKREDGDDASIPRRKRSSTNSEEEITVRREKQRELKRKQKERMTPDQRDALRARYREWRRRRKEVMTSEQLEIIRRGNRERQRRRRERLGVRKRLGSSSSHSRGASEAVIQGIRNMSQGRTASETSTSGESSKGSVSELMSGSGLTMDDKSPTVLSVAQASAMGISSLPTMVSTPLQGNLQNTSNTQQIATNVVTVPASYNQLPTSQQGISTIPVIGPQGTLLPGMPAGTFFPGIAMPGMQVTSLQGAIFPGMHVPVTGSPGNIVQGNQNITTITTIPMSGVPGIQTAQGGFLSGIPVTSTQGNFQNMQTAFPSQSPLTREGQVLHNFQALLPMTPVQASGPGMTFLTQMPFTGATTAQIQSISDPKYTTANHTNTQVQGMPAGAQLIQVPVPIEDPKPTLEEPKPQSKAKPKSRGRKRNTSAAEMLASLSTYIPQTSTPMSSMLSALASSARDRQASDPQSSDPTQDKNKSETVVMETSSAAAAVQGGVAAVQGVVAPQAVNMYVAPPRGIDSHPYMVRTVVSTPPNQTTVDVNANNYALAAISNGPSNIPHMNTFLTALGGNQRPGIQVTAAAASKDDVKISVAVSTDTIIKETKGTNTGEDGHPECSSSVGTMTDSLYRSSVATNTDLVTTVIDDVEESVKLETSEL